MGFEDLTDEQRDKARACKTKEELIAFAEEEGLQLGDSELEGIAGGEGSDIPHDVERCHIHCGEIHL